MVLDSRLQDAANILRRDVAIMTTAAKSGHPTSCFSCAEIMSVLFFDQMNYDIKNPNNPNNDEFILSKGHAAPILYASLFRAGCIKNNLNTLRKLSSPLEGHPTPLLKWIKIATGSLGQGLSIGIGFALAAKLQKRNFKTYVLLGDSELAEGSIYEALQLAPYYKLHNLIAIVDINRLGQTGETMLGHKIRAYKKRFKSFGWYVITINGHKIHEIKRAVEKAKVSYKPTMILAKTYKGKGVDFLEDKEGWHGKSMNEIQLMRALSEIPNPKFPKLKIKAPSNKSYNPKKSKIKYTKYKLGEDVATREAYGNILALLAKSNQNTIVLDGEVSNSTRSKEVKKATPKQFIESFIAEQNMIGMALGLSKKGFNVFASTFSSFLTRAHDQIRMSALSSANFTVVGSHSGVSIGEDGASQMGLEDISMFRSLPNSIIFYPSDAISTEKLTVLSSKLKGIKYIRTTRPKTLILYKFSDNFPLGDFKILKQSNKDKAVLAGSGITVHEALKAYDKLKEKNINVAVVDLYCIKPFNHKKFENFIKKHGKKLIIAEDHYPEGGIAEMLSRSNLNIKPLSIKSIPHSGSKDELLEKYKINWRAYVNEIQAL